jgi:phosphopantothenoylcysteine decarboxylase/phosphopantothenate--cysteine ligase
VNKRENPLTQANQRRLIASGGGRIETVGPDRGELACGWVGAGRLIEPAAIVDAAADWLARGALGVGLEVDLRGRAVIVTAGPTREPVDDVRFLGNRSSGKMGAALAEAAAAAGAAVTLVAGPGTPAVAAGIRRVDIETAAELERALGERAAGADVIVMAAAVADFRPATRAPGKLSRRDGNGAPALALTAVPDLLAGLARARQGDRPYLVGFAAETSGGEALAARALAKLREKGCDAIVANDVSAPGIGFSADDNQVTVFFPDGQRIEVPRASKRAVAERLWALFAPRLPPSLQSGRAVTDGGEGAHA